ncbi:DeoR/GlpR family DNA-binding transcription regulator [Nakamurella sp. A5-74]|uniref:Lactose phosphotransferase system repressor n=1 Tax=Nakamurella sp. A5-74 TaxID=3158264 RepID=A0AAU8DVL0_9ACTN
MPSTSELRRRAILDRARTEGRVDVTDLADDLGVASETIRRDLSRLENHGLIRRVHGGAQPVESAGYETSILLRAESRPQEKRRIAVAAAEHLGDAETVFIDEGFTPQLVAEELVASDRPLTFVTSSLTSAAILAANPAHTTIMLGGRIRGRTLGTVDHWATAMLADLRVDIAYLGANGVSRTHGLTTPDPAVAAVKRAAVAAARRRIFVGINTKFSVSSFIRFADLADFELLITDAGLNAHEAQRYAAAGTQVLRT